MSGERPTQMRSVYLAYPIDQADPADMETKLRWLRRQLCARQCAIYEPGMAWFVPATTPMDGRIQQTNNGALRQSDLLLVMLPARAQTRGVWAEMQLAIELGIPVVVHSPESPEFSALSAYVAEQIEWWGSDDRTMLEQVERAIARPMLRSTFEVANWRAHGPVSRAPVRGHSDDAGFDLFATEAHVIPPNGRAAIATDVSVKLPDGMWGLVHGRSSAWAQGLFVPTSVIDPSYRGELYSMVWNITDEEITVEVGQRVAQLLPLPVPPQMDWVEVDEWAPTERDARGYGSTGR